MPEEHDGETEFTLTLTFSEELEGLSYKTVRDSLFTREGGTIGGARRASPPSNKAFVLKVTPSADEAVTLTLKAVPPCGQEKTVCTAGGSVLSGPLGVTVPGPAALSVADAQVQEGPGAVLEFVVSLDRRRHAPVRVDYATAAGSGPGSGSGTGGRVEATLTGVFPWARHALSERLEAWGAAGYGQGELTVTPKKPGTDEDGAAIRTDLDLR